MLLNYLGEFVYILHENISRDDCGISDKCYYFIDYCNKTVMRLKKYLYVFSYICMCVWILYDYVVSSICL